MCSCIAQQVLSSPRAIHFKHESLRSLIVVNSVTVGWIQQLLNPIFAFERWVCSSKFPESGATPVLWWPSINAAVIILQLLCYQIRHSQPHNSYRIMVKIWIIDADSTAPSQMGTGSYRSGFSRKKHHSFITAQNLTNHLNAASKQTNVSRLSTVNCNK